MPAPDTILKLVDQFHTHLAAYKSAAYNEAQARREFIDPLFEALGWDMFNRQGFGLVFRDVIHEDAVKIAGKHQAPDYAFRIGGRRRFFVEAKKPAINLKDEISPAYQLRRYAWSAKLPLSILTDFEEFSVYDCRIRPYQGDRPHGLTGGADAGVAGRAGGGADAGGEGPFAAAGGGDGRSDRWAGV
jgi:predicted type IV restriction endonuclease